MNNKIDTLMIKIQKQLTLQHETLTCAESCTGGLIASKITANSGSSSIFKGSIITYSNEIKEQELNVSKDTMIKYGVVSCEVVHQMCIGALNKFNATYSIGISGIAGPTGGTINKPVGTVAIGVISKYGDQNIKIYHFSGNRQNIQQQATLKSLELIFEICNQNS